MTTTETPREAGRITVTRHDLTEALTAFYLTVRSGSGRQKGQVADPGGVADALHATLSRVAAERAPGDTPAARAVRDAGQVEAAAAVLERRYPAARPEQLDATIGELQAIARSWRRQAARVEAADRAAEAEATP